MEKINCGEESARHPLRDGGMEAKELRGNAERRHLGRERGREICFHSQLRENEKGIFLGRC